MSINHFRHTLYGHEFMVYTDHQPLVYAIRSALGRYSPREIRHLDFVSHFTADIRHVSGAHNLAADALSRVNSTSAPKTTTIDLTDFAAAQTADPEVVQLRTQLSPPRVSPSTYRRRYYSLRHLFRSPLTFAFLLFDDRFSFRFTTCRTPVYAPR
ncbi:hypothetical protein H7673_10785 [Streptococcus dysgalactiae subsp. equisimilis]|nr:hypothetical protein [Streptococcus dysgalactiae subsp. equisimilis]